MNDPLEALGFGYCRSRGVESRAAAETMMLTSYLRRAGLAGPVVPISRAPDFVLGPEVSPQESQDSRSPLHRSVSLAPKEGPDGLQEGPGDPEASRGRPESETSGPSLDADPRGELRCQDKPLACWLVWSDPGGLDPAGLHSVHVVRDGRAQIL